MDTNCGISFHQNIDIVFNLVEDGKQATFRIVKDSIEVQKHRNDSQPAQCQGSSIFSCTCGEELQINIFWIDESNKNAASEKIFYESKREVRQRRRALRKTQDVDPFSSASKVKAEPDYEILFDGVKQEMATVIEPETELKIETDSSEEQSSPDDIDLNNEDLEPPSKVQKLSVRTTGGVPKQAKNQLKGMGRRKCFTKVAIEIKDDRTLRTTADLEQFYKESERMMQEKRFPYYEIVTFKDGFQLHLMKSYHNNFYMTSFDTRTCTCDICGIYKRDANTLVTHRSDHFYNRNRCICYGCHAEFDTRDMIIRHVSYCRKNNKSISLTCFDCGQVFPCIKTMKIHEKVHITDLNKKRSVLCDICSKGFPGRF